MSHMMVMVDTRPVYRQFILLSLSLVSAFAIAQSVEHFDPQPNFDDRVTDEIFDSAGKWRQAPTVENGWRTRKDETVQNRRFHFGPDSAHEEMRYRNEEQFRDMGSDYYDLRPSSILKYNF
jgi:hypothetical protein